MQPPREIYENPRYAELLSDTEVQEHLANARATYLAQQTALQDSYPYKQEEIAHHRRTLTPTQDNETLQDDIKEFDTYNKKHKGTLGLLLKEQKQKDITTDDKRQYALNAWEQILQEKKAKWLEKEQSKQTLDYKQRVLEYLESLLEMKKFLRDLGGAGELFSEALDEVKQDLDVSNLGDEEYQKRLHKQGGGLPYFGDWGSDENARDRQKDRGGFYGNALFGGGFDLSRSKKNRIDINAIKRYFNTIQNSKALKEIVELLGRLEKQEEESEKQTIKELKSYSYTQVIPTKRYKEEMRGVTLGRDLENLLPQELAMLEDETLELLFDLKYIQNRLFCFEKQGYRSITQEAQEEIEKEIERKKQKKKEKNEGAIIICVDTSGSMSGKPEYIAKALTLYLATKASTQKRACYLINFSTDIETMLLSGRGGMAKLMQFMTMSFGGGTDVAPALQEGLRKMQQDDFKKSDLIVISDGGFDDISQNLTRQMQAQRQKDNKFYLLDIDGYSSQKGVFDKHWVYDATTQGIKGMQSILAACDDMERR